MTRAWEPRCQPGRYLCERDLGRAGWPLFLVLGMPTACPVLVLRPVALCLALTVCLPHPPSRLSVPAGFLLATILGTVCLAIASVIYLLVSGALTVAGMSPALSLALVAGSEGGACWELCVPGGW